MLYLHQLLYLLNFPFQKIYLSYRIESFYLNPIHKDFKLRKFILSF
jgi:hypothetical protein